MRSPLDPIYREIVRQTREEVVPPLVREFDVRMQQLDALAPRLGEIDDFLRQIDDRTRLLEERIPSKASLIFATDEEPQTHRKRLIDELIAQHPDAAAAHQMILEAINAIDDPHHRQFAVNDEVRHLQTFVMVPEGPGRLLDVADTISPALSHLKSWQVDSAIGTGINLESDQLPFDDASIDGMLLCEVLEHFNSDPMFCLIEINRVLRPDGFLVLTTPNAASWFAVYQILQHLQANRYANYGTSQQNRMHCIHAREYLTWEVLQLLEAAGFGDVTLTTKDYGISPPYRPIAGFDAAHRGETIYCRAYKRGPPRKRYLTPIYTEDRDFEGYPTAAD